MQATTALRAATSSTASYITTPGPVLHDISHVHCEEIDDYYNCNVLEINYNQQLTNGMNPDYARELPAHYLKHWGRLVDTGAYVSVARSLRGRYWCLRECGPEALRSGGTTRASTTSRTTTRSYIYPHQDLRDKDSTTGYRKAFFPCSLLHHRREADPTGTTGYTTRRHSVNPTAHLHVNDSEG